MIRNKKISLVTFIWLLLSILSTGLLFAETKENRYETLKKEFEQAPPPSFFQSVKTRKLTQSKSEAVKPSLSQNDKLARLEKQSLSNENELAFIKSFSGLKETDWAVALKVKDDLAAIKELLAEKLDLNLLIALGVYRNPGLKAAQQKIKAAINEYSQTANLRDILSQYISFAEALNTRVGPKQHKPMISMLYPYPGMTSIRGDIINIKVKLAQNSYLIKTRNLISNLKKSYYQLAYLKEAEKTAREDIDLLSAIKEISEALFTTAKASFNDVINIQIKIDVVNDKLQSTKDKQAVVMTQFRRLLSLPPHFQLAFPPEVKRQQIPYELAELFELGDINNLEIKAQKLKLAKMKKMIIMTEIMSYPDFASNNSYFENREIAMLGSGKMKEAFSVKKPSLKPWFAKNDAYIRELKDEYAAMEEKLEDIIDEIRNKTEKTWIKITESIRKSKLYQDILIPQVDQSLEVTQTGYQSGKVNFADLLRAYNTWLDYHLKYHLAIKNVNQRITELENIVSLKLIKKENSNEN